MTQRYCVDCNAPISHGAKQWCVTCRNRHLARRQSVVKGKPCEQCGRIGYDRKSMICRFCQKWTPEQIDYLRTHYATDGAASIATALNLPLKRIRDRANKMGLKLNKTATKRIVNAKAKSYMLTQNPMKRPEVVQKVREWRVNNPEQSAAVMEKLLEGKQRLQRTKASKLEQRLFHILDDLGIAYEPIALIKPNFLVDARIGSLIIQADGEYWHGHPRFEPLTERQQTQQRRDATQDKYLHTCGYTVVRVWDRDVNPEYIADILHKHGLL
jgi:G:T-mismatch repair DNA endonuclease (very short patch repair protein)